MDDEPGEADSRATIPPVLIRVKYRNGTMFELTE